MSNEKLTALIKKHSLAHSFSGVSTKLEDFNEIHFNFINLKDIVDNDLSSLIMTHYPKEIYLRFKDFKSTLDSFNLYCYFPNVSKKNVIGFGGKFSSGKSSIINKILGVDLLPSGIDPTTSIPTYISKGRGDFFEVTTDYGKKFSLFKCDFIDTFTKDPIEIDDCFLSSISLSYIELKDFVWDDLVLIDTPGYSSCDQSDYLKAKKQLSSANVIVWVLSADSGGFSEDELGFISELKDSTPKLFIVSHADKKTESEVFEIISLAKKKLFDHGVSFIDVVPSSIRSRSFFGVSDIEDFFDKYNFNICRLDFIKELEDFFDFFGGFLDSEADSIKKKTWSLISSAFFADCDNSIDDSARVIDGIKSEMNTIINVRKDLKKIREEFFFIIEKIIKNIDAEVLSSEDKVFFLEKRAESPTDWIDCADRWSHLGQSDNSTRCVKSAYDKFFNRENFIHREWFDVIDNSICSEVKCKALELLEERLRTTSLWCQAAKHWNILDRSEKAKFCFDKAILVAKSSSDYVTLAAAGKGIIPCFDEGFYVEKSFKKADDFLDWWSIADHFSNKNYSKERLLNVLKKAESFAKNPGDWVRLAKIYIESFNDTTKAESCFLGVYQYANSSIVDCLIAIKEFHRILDDSNKISALLSHLEGITVEPYLLCDIAECWLIVFDDYSSAFKAIKRAEEYADNFYDWQKITYCWHNTFKEKNNLIRCLLVCETFSDSAFGWVLCAENWLELVDSKNEAIRCIKHALSQADSIDDYINIASFFSDRINNHDYSSYCLKMAGNLSHSTYEWLRLSSFWLDKYSDYSNSLSCVFNAYKSAEHLDEWIGIAKFFACYFEDTGRAIILIELLECDCKTYDDWLHIADFYYKNKLSKEKISFCLEKSESVAVECSDWLHIADFYYKNKLSKEKISFCLEKSESVAVECSDWCDIAEFWAIKMYDSKRSDLCLSTAESLADSDELGMGYTWIRSARTTIMLHLSF